MAAAAEASAALINTTLDWLGVAAKLVGQRAVHVLAPAERIGSAEQSALMLREVPRIRADACETGDWSHVDVYLSKLAGEHRACAHEGLGDGVCGRVAD